MTNKNCYKIIKSELNLYYYKIINIIMTPTIVKISSQGQITLPKQLIKDNQINLGTQYECRIIDGQIILKIKPNPFLEFEGILKNKTDLTTNEFISIAKQESKLHS